MPWRRTTSPKNALSHRGRRVRVAQWDEVRILGESINDREDDQFPVNARQTLDEVHGDVLPNCRRHRQWLK